MVVCGRVSSVVMSSGRVRSSSADGVVMVMVVVLVVVVMVSFCPSWVRVLLQSLCASLCVDQDLQLVLWSRETIVIR